MSQGQVKARPLITLLTIPRSTQSANHCNCFIKKRKPAPAGFFYACRIQRRLADERAIPPPAPTDRNTIARADHLPVVIISAQLTLVFVHEFETCAGNSCPGDGATGT